MRLIIYIDHSYPPLEGHTLLISHLPIVESYTRYFQISFQNLIRDEKRCQAVNDNFLSSQLLQVFQSKERSKTVDTLLL